MSSNSRSYELECTRLAAECVQMARDVDHSDLQRHFLQMAYEWSIKAERGPSPDTYAAQSVGSDHTARLPITRH
jgi:hypothetical protein